METVRQILDSKAPGVVMIGPDASVYEALALMAEREIGALVVWDAGRIAGIMSERDYARKVILHNKSSREIPVSEIMTDMVVSVSPADTVADCMRLMTSHHVRHLPVIDRGQLVGLVSIGDLVKATITEQQFVIRQLETYIHG